MLDNSFLEKWVPIIVPPQYGPNRELDAKKPLLGVYLVDEQSMEKSRNIWYKDSPEDSKLYGQIVDLGGLLRMTGEEKERLNGKFVIRINSSIDETAAIYALAHETGHLVGFIENPEEHEKDMDTFADEYAMKRVVEVIEDSYTRFLVLLSGITGTEKKA